jgi:hypothetical protein
VVVSGVDKVGSPSEAQVGRHKTRAVTVSQGIVHQFAPCATIVHCRYWGTAFVCSIEHLVHSVWKSAVGTDHPYDDSEQKSRSPISDEELALGNVTPHSCLVRTVMHSFCMRHRVIRCGSFAAMDSTF